MTTLQQRLIIVVLLVILLTGATRAYSIEHHLNTHGTPPAAVQP